MSQELEKLTTSHERITSALEETSDLQNRQQIAALADEFWQQWTIRQGLALRGTGNCQIKEQGEKENESRQSTERSILPAEVATPLLRSPVRSRAAHAGASRTD
jgi:hypothetical protein